MSRTPRFVEDGNEFALALSRPLLRERGNLFFSPFGIRAALGMACTGARGRTAEQMREALGLPPPGATELVAPTAIFRGQDRTADREYELAVANSLWAQQGAPLKAGFVESVTRHDGAGVEALDFRADPEAARVAINQWTEDRTNRRICGLIPPDGLNADTRLVLANAVYFHGTWELQFQEAATFDEPFHLEGGGQTPAPLMRLFAVCPVPGGWRPSSGGPGLPGRRPVHARAPSTAQRRASRARIAFFRAAAR